MDPKLIYGVTILGVLLSVFSFVVILRGRALPGEGGAAHEVEFRGLKLRTSAMVMLLAVSVIVAVLPLVLQYLLSTRAVAVAAPPAQPKACPPVPPAVPECKIWLTGQVTDEGRNPIAGAQVTVLDITDTKPGAPPDVVNRTQTDVSGTYDIPAFTIGTIQRYKVVAEKNGYVAPKAIHMGPAGGVTLNAMLVSNKKARGGTP